MSRPVKKLPIFFVVAVGVFMSTLDSSMVNIALPSIMHEFHSSLYSTEWVVMAYLLMITVSLLFWGHLGDRCGRRKIYALGMLIFGVGSFLCGISPNIYLLIGCRLFQASGASMMMASGPALIRESFPSARLGRNLGLIGIAVSLGLMTGPSIGGFLIEYQSWRAIFFVTAPIGLVFFLFAVNVLPGSSGPAVQEKFDTIGSLAWAASATIGLFALADPSSTWENPLFSLIAVIGLILFILFIRHETRIANPLFPLHLLHKRFFSIAVICAMLSFSILFTVTILTPFYLDRILGLSASRIGMIMMAIPVSVLAVAPAAGWLSDHVGARYLTTAGLLTSTVSLFLLTGLNTETTPIEVAWRLVLLGGGQAMFLAPNSASVLANVESYHTGVSAGLLATARNFGMLLGVAQAGTIFSYFYRKHSDGLDLKDFTAVHSQSFMSALEVTFLTAGAIGVVGVILSWLRGKGLRRSRRKSGVPADEWDIPPAE
jgi:EmrB/QacA subfamily drug resistance transporter